MILKNSEIHDVKVKVNAFQEKNNIHAHMYSVEAINELLKQPDVTHIQVKYGLDDNGDITSVINAVSKNTNLAMMAAPGISCPPQCAV
jgi:hypothetical protein